MNRQSIFRVMALVVVMLAVGISANAQTNKADANTNAKQDNTVLTLEPAKMLIEPGQVQKIEIKDHSTKEKIEWSSSDKEVALVDNDGNVKAVKEGKTTIIATSGKVEGKCEVIVEKKEGTGKNTDVKVGIPAEKTDVKKAEEKTE
jgi:uncharacterized protein YjdB